MNNIFIIIALITVPIIYNYRQKIFKLFLNIYEKIKIKLLIITYSIIKFFSIIQKQLEENLKPINSNNLEDLTPYLSDIERNEVKNIQNTYLNSLKYAVQDKNIVNIALTGGFGSGKSTIINEFINSNKGYKYLQISLASFKNENLNDDEKLLETSILQQIIFFEKKNIIKESSFRRIDFSNYKIKTLYTLLIILWIYSVIVLFFEKVKMDVPFVKKEDINLNNVIYFENIITIIFLLGFFKIIYEAYDKLKNFKLSKLTPNSFEITNENNENQLSVFNRNIEEIIYFFEKTDTNVVIIEDIDRFKAETAQRLFSKIRELAVLIKQSKNISQPVKFIYAVKDEILTDEKTKFFDIIIPVLPITDYSNSKNIFIKKLNPFFEPELIAQIDQKSDVIKNDEKLIDLNKDLFSIILKKIKEKFSSKIKDVETDSHETSIKEDFIEPMNYLDKNFVSEVSNYVFDMRTIKNICNEYKIYHTIQTTNKSSINSNKLFALVLYKNIFSEDFALIQKGSSNLHKIFSKEKNSNLRKIINSKILKVNFDKTTQKINERDIKIKDLDNHILNDVIELRKVYIYSIIQKIHSENKGIVSIEDNNLGDLTIENIFNKLKLSTRIKYEYMSNNYNINTKYIGSFKDVEKEINQVINYDQREKIIKDFHNREINKIQKEINILINEKTKIENLSIQELYIKYPLEIEFHIKKLFEIKSTEEKLKSIDEKTINIKSDFIKNTSQDEIDLYELINLNESFGLILNLIRNGYINEEFPNYLSYFYPGSLTTNDHNLLMKIIDNKPTKFDEKIDNINNLVCEIRDLNFKNNSILINEILQHLLLCYNPFLKKSIKLDFLIDQICEIINIGKEFSSLKRNNFVETFVESNIENKDIMFSFYDEIINKTDNFLFFIQRNISDDKLFDKIIYDMFDMFSDTIKYEEYFSKLNKKNFLTEYINQKSDFLLNVNKGIMLVDILKKLNIQFKQITYNEKLNKLLLDIYKNNLYQINFENLKLFSQIDEKYNFEEEKFIHSNYSLLCSQKDTHLFRRISENMNEYIEKVYLKIEVNNKEKALIIQELLELEQIESKTKNDIIDKGFNGKIKSIAKIKDYSVAESLLNHDKVENSWQTIIDFRVWKDYDFDVIAMFINNNENYKKLKINELKVNEEELFDSDENLFKEFVYQIINCEEISKDSFESIFELPEDLVLESNKVGIEKRLSFLIERKIIILNNIEYEYLKVKDEDFLVQLLVKNEIKFLEEIIDFEMDISLLQKLLKSKFSVKGILQLIENEESNILENSNESFLIDLTTFLVNNNINNYSFELYYFILESSIPELLKIKLFNVDFSTHDDISQTIKSLEILDGNFVKILNKEEVEFPNKEPYIEFLNNLKSKKHIRRTYALKNQMLRVNYD